MDDEIEKKLSEVNMFGGNIAENDFAGITQYVHSGNYALNALLTGSLRRGFPNSRSICLAGEEGVGKTYLALNACKHMQDAGYKPIFFDTEGAVDTALVKKFGIDPDGFRHEPVNKVEKFQQLITIVTKKGMEAMERGEQPPRLFPVLDSLGNMASAKEIEDAMAGNEKADLKKAKTIRSIFRIITSDLTGLKMPFLFTNHIQQSPDAFAGKDTVGGMGQKYGPSAIVFLTKAKKKDDKNDSRKQTGITATAETKKNRLAVPNYVKFDIRFDRGMNPYHWLENYVDWETCGIEEGKVLTEKQAKSSKKAKEYVDDDGVVHYLEPKPKTGRYAVAHLGKSVLKNDQEFFTPEVFTDEVIDKLDEKKVKPEFSYSGSIDDESPEDVVGGTDSSEEK